jgi:hypothetical protein
MTRSSIFDLLSSIFLVYHISLSAGLVWAGSCGAKNGDRIELE